MSNRSEGPLWINTNVSSCVRLGCPPYRHSSTYHLAEELGRLMSSPEHNLEGTLDSSPSNYISNPNMHPGLSGSGSVQPNMPSRRRRSDDYPLVPLVMPSFPSSMPSHRQEASHSLILPAPGNLLQPSIQPYSHQVRNSLPVLARVLSLHKDIVNIRLPSINEWSIDEGSFSGDRSSFENGSVSGSHAGTQSSASFTRWTSILNGDPASPLPVSRTQSPPPHEVTAARHTWDVVPPESTSPTHLTIPDLQPTLNAASGHYFGHIGADELRAARGLLHFQEDRQGSNGSNRQPDQSQNNSHSGRGHIRVNQSLDPYDNLVAGMSQVAGQFTPLTAPLTMINTEGGASRFDQLQQSTSVRASRAVASAARRTPFMSDNQRGSRTRSRSPYSMNSSARRFRQRESPPTSPRTSRRGQPMPVNASSTQTTLSHSAKVAGKGLNYSSCIFAADTKDGCKIGKGEPTRKGVSHFFGRNKKETRGIPDDCFPVCCRKHYQRKKYASERVGTFYLFQSGLVELAFDSIEKRMEGPDVRSKINWTIKFQKSLQNDINDDNAVRQGSPEKGKRKEMSPEEKEKFLRDLNVSREFERYCGNNKTTDDCRDFLSRCVEACRDGRISKLVDAEYLPVQWGDHQPPQK